MIAFPPFRLDLDEGRLWKGETPLTLRRKPFAILCHLAARPQKLVTHDELLAEVWGGAVVSDSAVRSHLHELRQVLGDGVIETVIGRGYRFVAELRDEVVVAPITEGAPVDPLIVGREVELAMLRSAFERALGGRRQLCFVTGEAGIGKSTLVRTFLAGLDPSSVIVGRGSCFEQYSAPEPYLPIIEALGALGRSARGAQTLKVLVRHAPTFVAQVPHLVSDDQLSDVSRRAAFGNESRQLRELSEAFEAMCSSGPLVLVLEDLQWSDVATIDLLSHLGQRQERAKLLVIGTSRHAEIQRPDHPLNHVMRSLVARSGALMLRVPHLDNVAVQSFIDRRFSGHALPRELTDLIARITGGTPLYVVSLLDELAGRGMLVERDDRWVLAVSIDEVRAHRPASVKQLIDMQLDRLPAAEQRVLEAASIVGTEFSTNLVAAALELSADQVDDTCDALARRSLFLRAEPDGRYAVTHALIQEVCVERSSPTRRQRWHRLVAEALERDPRTSEISPLLAKHFDAADDPKRAVPAYASAARQAGQRYATSDAVALCARALDLLPRLPAGRERDLLELRIIETLCRQVSSNSFSAAFAGREPLAVYARAIEIARSFGDPASSYAAITRLCNYHMITADYDRAAALSTELEPLEQAHDLDPGLLFSGIFARAFVAFFRADLGTARCLFERLVPEAHEESAFHANLPGRALALGHLACVRWVIGEPERALEEATMALDIANGIELPILQALGHAVRARLRYLRRDPLEVIDQEAPEALQATALDLGLHTEVRAVALWAQARRGPLELGAIQPMLDGLTDRLTQVATCSTLVAQVLIDVLRLSGHLAEARKLTDEIIAFAVARNESVYLPELLRLRGEQVAATDPAAATRDYREAIELARSTGARSLEQRASDSLAAVGARRPTPRH
jgi:DNA-binding winged helix-turn-helix (wHTH) protein